MADQYIGVGGIARKVKSEFVGVDGIARKTNAGYVGVNGIARKFFPGGVPLSAFAEGSLVKIKEKGVLVDYYVAKHNYESGLNGNGKTCLMRKEVINPGSKWDLNDPSSEEVCNLYPNSTLNSSNANFVVNNLGAPFNDLICNIKIPIGLMIAGYMQVSSFDCKVFSPSVTELKKSDSSALKLGSAFKIPTSAIKGSISGKAYPYWTRSDRLGDVRYFGKAYAISPEGACNPYDKNTAFSNGYLCIRPCFTLPADTPVNPDTNTVLG